MYPMCVPLLSQQCRLEHFQRQATMLTEQWDPGPPATLAIPPADDATTAAPTPADHAPHPDQPASNSGRFGSAPRVLHGPPRPAPALSGVDRLHCVLGVSGEVTTDQLCDDAANELEQLRAADDVAFPDPAGVFHRPQITIPL